MSSIIFKASCELNTIFIKNLIEMMSQVSSVENIKNIKSIKQICLKINKNYLEFFSDINKVVTSSAIIEKNFFTEFFYEDNFDLCIGVSLDILKSCFKYINRNDKFSIIIEKEEYNNFPDTISFVFNNKGFNVKFNIVQNVENNNYINYKQILKMESAKFSNLYKEIGGPKKKVNFNIANNKMSFKSSVIDIAENWVDFKIENKDNINCNSILKSEHFKIASKIAIFDDYMNFLVDENANILLETNIVNTKESKMILGKIFINIVTQVK